MAREVTTNASLNITPPNKTKQITYYRRDVQHAGQRSTTFKNSAHCQTALLCEYVTLFGSSHYALSANYTLHRSEQLQYLLCANRLVIVKYTHI
jgi:hypothetical protein